MYLAFQALRMSITVTARQSDSDALGVRKGERYATSIYILLAISPLDADRSSQQMIICVGVNPPHHEYFNFLFCYRDKESSREKKNKIKKPAMALLPKVKYRRRKEEVHKRLIGKVP